MRLLYIVENYPPHYGGVEVVFQNTCEGMAARGHRVTLVTHLLKGSKRRERKNSVRIFRVPCLHSRYLFTFLAPFHAMKHARKADLIHTTTFNAAPAAWLVARLTGKQVLLTVHEIWRHQWHRYTNKHGLDRILHELLEWAVFLPRYDRYICVSESTARNLKEYLPKRLHDRIVVNQNGFDYSHWDRKKHTKQAKELRSGLKLEKKFVILGYGRPGYAKGFEFLIKAFPRIKRGKPNAHLLLILSKDKQFTKPYDRLMQLIDELGITEVTVLPPQGYQSLPAYVAMADCVVVPSLAEGFGYTTIESNTIGTPVVASDTTSIPEVISGEYLLAKPGSPASIAKQVLKAAKGECKRTKPKRFTWKKNLDRLEKLYNQIM